MTYVKVFISLLLMFSVALTACAPASAPSEKYAEYRSAFEYRSDAVGETYGKLAASEKTEAYYRPAFYAKPDDVRGLAGDGSVKFSPVDSLHWSLLWIYPAEPVIGETIYASSVFSNVVYRSDRLQFIRYELCDELELENDYFKRAKDDAQYFELDPFSGALSWKKIPPPGKYQFALTVKAFDAEHPELFDQLTVTFAITRDNPPVSQTAEELNAMGNDGASPDLAEETAPTKSDEQTE